MPSLGADMSAGTLAAWLKQPGDAVERGDIIAVVHTDKADVEVEVFTSGVIERMLVEPGTEVPVGTPLAVIREEGARRGSGSAPAPRLPAPAAAAPAATRGAARGSGRAAPRVPAEHHLLISPSARQLAHELGVETDALAGRARAVASSAGRRGGRCAAMRRRKKPRPAAAAPPAAAPPPAAPPPFRPWRRSRRPQSAAPPCAARSPRR